MWSQRFDAFARRKARDAEAADVPGLVTIVDRSEGFPLERVGSDWTRARFDGAFYWSTGAGRLSVNLVFVQSREGNTVADDPGELGGGDTDQHLIYEGLSRVHADAVLAGARTVAGADLVFSVWHPELVRLRGTLGKPRHPAQIVVSVDHAVSVRESLIFNVPEVPAILITTDAEAASYAASASRRPWVDVIGTGDTIDLRRGLESLARDHGVRVISCVGGRTTATTLIDAGLVQDLYLTTSPKSGGEPNTPLSAGGAPNGELVVRKRGRGADSGVVFEHLRLATDLNPQRPTANSQGEHAHQE